MTKKREPMHLHVDAELVDAETEEVLDTGVVCIREISEENVIGTRNEVMSTTTGPAKVNSNAFRNGWDEIYGAPKNAILH